MVAEPEFDQRDPFDSGESEVVVDLGDSPDSPPSDPEIDLGQPPNPAGVSLEVGSPPKAEPAPAAETLPEVDDQPVFSGLESSLSESAAPVPEALPEVEEKPIAPGESEAASGPSPEVEGSTGVADKAKNPKEESVVEADDVDLEGLGMVLGNDSKE
jgi:hypothetical protein